MAEPIITTQAHCKLLLHAAKYPHAAVNGVLLAEDNRHKDTKILKYVDCIPLFHVSLGLSPMLEVALTQIDNYCKSKGLVIAGYYQANENYSENELNYVAKTIGKKIQDNFHDALLFMIDNRLVKSDAISQPYQIYSFKETGWKELDHKTSEDDVIQEECVYGMLESKAHRQLVDFDNHLDDIKQDWRNLEINDQINRYT